MRIILRLKHERMEKMKDSQIVRDQDEKEKAKGNKQWMQCSYRSQCKESCGHKYKHLENTGCKNACVSAPDRFMCVKTSKP